MDFPRKGPVMVTLVTVNASPPRHADTCVATNDVSTDAAVIAGVTRTLVHTLNKRKKTIRWYPAKRALSAMRKHGG